MSNPVSFFDGLNSQFQIAIGLCNVPKTRKFDLTHLHHKSRQLSVARKVEVNRVLELRQ